MKYSMAQINPKTGDIQGNRRRIEEAMENAEGDIVAFPEMALTGYCIGDKLENDQFLEENKQALNEIAETTGQQTAIVGYLEGNGDTRYNAAAILNEGEIKGKAFKRLLPNYRYFDDERYFESGEEPEVADLEIGDEQISLGVSICEDLWSDDYDEEPITELAREGAEAIININASPFEPGKRHKRDEIIRNRLEDLEVTLLYVNTVGVADVGKNILAFDGDSLAYNSEGELVGKADRFSEDTVTLNPDEESKIGLENVDWRESTYEALKMALEDYMDKTGFEKVVEPVSGGIDSSLGLAICVDAVGPENVIAYNMPSEVNSETTKDIAEQLSNNLGVDYRTLPVQGAFEEVVNTYEQHVDQIDEKVAMENIYARLRGVFSMLETNENQDTMLVSNGNRTEMALGYSTLYGDMNGGLSLLGDISKNEVYELARYVNQKEGEEIIPNEVFEIPPSAELSEDQEDPFDYEVISPLVDEILEQRKGPERLVEEFEEGELGQGYPDNMCDRYDADSFEELVRDIYSRFQNTSFKRVQSPPVISVTQRSFGTDFREPIIDGWSA